MAQAYNWLLATWVQNVEATGCSHPNVAIHGDENRPDILHRAARHFGPLTAFVPENAIRACRHDKTAFGRDRSNWSLRKARRLPNLATRNHPKAACRSNPNGATAIDANTMTATNRIRTLRFYPRGPHQNTRTYFGRNPRSTSLVEHNCTDIVFICGSNRPRLVVLLPKWLVQHRDGFCVCHFRRSHVRLQPASLQFEKEGEVNQFMFLI